MLSCLLLPLLFAFPQSGYDADPEGTAARWIVVYNSNWPDADGNGVNDSLEVAQHWMQRRHVPQDRLLGVACSTGTAEFYSGQVGWENFWDEMVVPLRTAAISQTDNHVLGFLFCYGVPFRIAPPGYTNRGLDTTLAQLWNLGDRTTPSYAAYGSGDSYFDAAPGFGIDPGRFNPDVHRIAGQRTYLVARLDGLDKEHAIELVDMALYGDVYLSTQPGFYSGTAYCDTQYGAYTAADLAGYPFGHWIYANADKDMAYGRDFLSAAGFALQWEPYSTEIGEPNATWENGSPADAAPDAMIYEGWYNFNKYQDVWTWKVGSMACDLNSNSVAHMRDAQPGTFLGEALQQGLTCGPGVIAEPYLNGHPYPEVFAYYMVNGYPFAEAARVSDSKIKWTNIYVGDPLYQPFRLGKVALQDTTPPPASQILAATWSGSPGAWDVKTFLDTAGTMPDLITLQMQWGTTSALGNTVSAQDARPRLFHQVSLDTLPTNALVFYRADGTDPSGNLGLGQTMVLHTGLEAQPVAVSLFADATVVPVGTPVTVTMAFGANDGFSSLNTSLTLTASHLGLQQVDVLPRFFSPAAQRYRSADDTVRATSLILPPLSVGTYTFDIAASNAAGMDSASLTVQVQ